MTCLIKSADVEFLFVGNIDLEFQQKMHTRVQFHISTPSEETMLFLLLTFKL